MKINNFPKRLMMVFFVMFIFYISATNSLYAQPSVNFFAHLSVKPNDTVAISRTDFNITKLSNIEISGTNNNVINGYGKSNLASPNFDSNTMSVLINASNSTNLSSLTTSAGTLSPAFSSGTNSYTLTVSNASSSITVSPTVEDAVATVQVQINNGSFFAVTSGNSSIALALNEGTNTVNILVTAQNGAVKTYTIVVCRSILPSFTTIAPVCQGSSFILPITSNNGITGTWTPAINSMTTTVYTFLPNANQCASFVQTTVSVGTQTTWNNSTWSNGIPTATSKAVISSNYAEPIDLTACTLEITGNSVVNVPSGFDFKITNQIAVASTASLIFENNSNLIQISNATNTGNITIKRNTFIQRLAYTYWSSPVANQNALAFSPQTFENRFFTFNEAINGFLSVVSPSTTNLIPTVGYGIRAPNIFADAPAPATQFVGTFTGVPNNGDYNYAGTKISDGYNLIGNPYPSTIFASAFFTANPAVTALHFWNNSVLDAINGSNFATRTNLTGIRATADINSLKVPSNFISVGQGFFITLNAPSTINFTNAMRSPDNADAVFFRNSTNDKSLFKLNLLSPTTTFNQIAIGYMDGATNGFDNQIDAVPFAQNTTMISSLINNLSHVIQGRPLPFANTDTVPLGFKTDVAGNYSFTTEAFEGVFANNQNIFLKDNLVGITHNVKQSPYSFTSNVGTFNSRFEIIYQSNLSIENPNFNDNNVFVFIKKRQHQYQFWKYKYEKYSSI